MILKLRRERKDLERTSQRRGERLGTECVTSLETEDLSEGRALRMIAGPLDFQRKSFFLFQPLFSA